MNIAVPVYDQQPGYVYSIQDGRILVIAHKPNYATPHFRSLYCLRILKLGGFQSVDCGKIGARKFLLFPPL